MKKLSIIFCLIFFVGCANENFPLRSQVHTGMTLTQVWELYGYNSSDPNTYKNKVYYENIDEQVAGECILKTYRFWFKNTRKNISTLPGLTAKPIPSLLTFQSCRLPNYDEVQKEKKRRKASNEAIINHPDIKKEIDIFCKENQCDSPEDRAIVIELLIEGSYKDNPLPQCVTNQTLIKISLDQATIRHRQNQKAMSNQYQQTMNQLQKMERKASFDRMMRGGLP